MKSLLLNVMIQTATVLAAAATVQIAGAHPAQGQPEAPKMLKGYVKAIAGEQLDYNCFNPLATTSLLTRCTTGAMAIEWETEPIPEKARGNFVTFEFIVSYSTMTSSGNRSFDFFINDQKEFVIKTFRGVNDRQWSLKGEGGAELRFQFVKEDAARDANGTMYLTVPVNRFRKGKPLRLKVVGEKADANDWFMTFMYDLRHLAVEILPLPVLTEQNGALRQSIAVALTYLKDSGNAVITVDGGASDHRTLMRGFDIFEYALPAVNAPREVAITVTVDGGAPETLTTTIRPVARRTVYLLPHSHNDIGYTDVQTDVLKKQLRNISDALDLIRKSAANPPEARFKWNIEILWPVETFLETATSEKKQEFLDAVRGGSIGIEALYANVLTGLMRPEEFIHLTEFARSLKARYGIPVTTAMMTDIPGMTWNMVPALADAGINYFSSGPNGSFTGGDRTGYTNHTWGDRPFYWVSPSGCERILYWMTGFGYSTIFASFSTQPDARLRFLRNLSAYFGWLDEIGYPYDMVQMRHTVNGDNGTVDPGLPQFVMQWNESHVSPKLAISTTEGLFRAFEKKYGAELPVFSGDLTPYWEDGAASTAYELGVNRGTAEHLVQTEALYAMLDPAKYSEQAFARAWSKVLLFDEHTWGAFNSISDPDSPLAVNQWTIKQRFALDGAKEAADLRAGILNPSGAASPGAFDVFNTNSWERTDLVVLSAGQSATGDVVKDDDGKAVPSQRLANGELAFLAERVPALGAKRFTISAGKSSFTSGLRVEGTSIRDGNLEVTVDKESGNISRLRTSYPRVAFVDTSHGDGLNQFFYVFGLNPKEAVTSGKPAISVNDRGPLVASIVATSQAPGCNALRREVRVIAGTGRVDVTDTIDKQKVRKKEAVHFGFPFAVPQGVVRIDLGFAVIRPEADQLPGSCKDYYSAQRWVDVSNQDYGVTMTVAEAPLVEVGGLHSELPSPRDVAWRTTQWSSPRLASYVMNNYWHTNYKADQEGASTFHYSLLPHGIYHQADAVRLGIERSQPLIVHQVSEGEKRVSPLFDVTPGGVIVSSVKPDSSGRGLLVRLFNAGGMPDTARLSFGGQTRSVYLSSPFGERGKKVDAICLPAEGMVTLRIE